MGRDRVQTRWTEFGGTFDPPSASPHVLRYFYYLAVLLFEQPHPPTLKYVFSTFVNLFVRRGMKKSKEWGNLQYVHPKLTQSPEIWFY